MTAPGPQIAAASFQQLLVPALFEPWATELLEQSHISNDQRVLDLGCGTGIVARLAAPAAGISGSVIGLDIDKSRLDVARSLPDPSGAATSWCLGTATALPFASASFNVAVGQQVLQFIPDRLVALQEVKRILVPGGRLGISVWRSAAHNPGAAAVRRAIAPLVGDIEASQRTGQFQEWSARGLREMLTAAGFSTVRVRANTKIARFPSVEQYVRDGFAAAYVGLSIEARASAEARAVASLARYCSGSSLAVPYRAYIAWARA